MPLTSYAGLLSRQGPPFLNAAPLITTGKVLFVDSNTGKANNTGDDPLRPLATAAQAVAKFAATPSQANKGAYVVFMPGHAETVAGLTLSLAGVRYIGLGVARNRPTFTADGTAADVINVTAANVHMENIRLVGASANCTALLDLSSAADDFTGVDLEFVPAATPLETMTISAQRGRLVRPIIHVQTNGPDRFMSVEARADNWHIVSPRLFAPAGLDNEFIKSVKVCAGWLIEDAKLVGLDSLVINFASSSAGPPDSLFESGTFMYSAAVTSVEDGVAAATSLGWAFGFDVRAVDVTAKRAGGIPLATAS